jgi:hypothetical protein
MSDKSTKNIMIGILICLIVIALKPVPSFQSEFPSSVDVSAGESVVQLGENRIAIVDNNLNSGMRGEVFVLEFNKDKKTFDLIGRYNYVDFFHNPQNYPVGK